MKKVVMGLSGGLDSAALCAYYLDREFEVFPLIFYYGSKHNLMENMAAHQLCKHWGLTREVVDLSFIGNLFRSNLLVGQGEIPEGHYLEENMRQTVVPARNMIFLSILAGYAESLGADRIALGVHAGDHFIYPDCRPEFLTPMGLAIEAATDGKVVLETPFSHIDKTEILRRAVALKVPLEMTRTCYKASTLACGKCGSCNERLEAFQKLGLEDPLEYVREGQDQEERRVPRRS